MGFVFCYEGFSFKYVFFISLILLKTLNNDRNLIRLIGIFDYIYELIFKVLFIKMRLLAPYK